MIDQWREWLYPLGFISAVAFSSRMILQWLLSEAKGKSVVTAAFWRLSLVGNITLAIQACNAVISWRNLNLMKATEDRLSFASVIKLFAFAIGLTIFVFSLQGSEWFRIPTLPWQSSTSLHIPLWWHLIGFAGLALFSSRFWVQWWAAEKIQESHLGVTFWWISLIGELLCLVYFLSINDPVNFIGPVFAMIPYIRNLMLIRKQHMREQE